ncbi:hypothetical protein BEQ56_05040 [Anaerolineaceae bacterium oral taxon 439]|nr:hypothetical protein BEQ56_05040 [Anaerolineaceae bacterium oral taxon 439]
MDDALSAIRKRMAGVFPRLSHRFRLGTVSSFLHPGMNIATFDHVVSGFGAEYSIGSNEKFRTRRFGIDIATN